MSIRKSDDARRPSEVYTNLRVVKGVDGAWDTRSSDHPGSDGQYHRRAMVQAPKPSPAVPAPALTGGKSQHYQVQIQAQIAGGGLGSRLVQFDCNDLIEELSMTFAEGEVFKAVWRKAAARQGKGKPGHQPLYDAQKIEFFGKRMVAIHAKKA